MSNELFNQIDALVRTNAAARGIDLPPRHPDLEAEADRIEAAQSDADWHEQLTDVIGDAFCAYLPRSTGWNAFDADARASYERDAERQRVLRDAYRRRDWATFGQLIEAEMRASYFDKAERSA